METWEHKHYENTKANARKTLKIPEHLLDIYMWKLRWCGEFSKDDDTAVSEMCVGCPYDRSTELDAALNQNRT